MTNEDKGNLDTLNKFAGTAHPHPLNLESDFRVNFEKYLNLCTIENGKVQKVYFGNRNTVYEFYPNENTVEIKMKHYSSHWNGVAHSWRSTVYAKIQKFQTQVTGEIIQLPDLNIIIDNLSNITYTYSLVLKSSLFTTGNNPSVNISKFTEYCMVLKQGIVISEPSLKVFGDIEIRECITNQGSGNLEERNGHWPYGKIYEPGTEKIQLANFIWVDRNFKSPYSTYGFGIYGFHNSRWWSNFSRGNSWSSFNVKDPNHKFILVNGKDWLQDAFEKYGEKL